MDDLYIPGSHETPAISFEFSRHQLSLRGESYPENPTSFYDPIHSSLRSYLDRLPADCRVNVSIDLRCFSGSSAKHIRGLVGMLDKTAVNGPSISVDWLHEQNDEVMRHFGVDLMEEHPSLKFKTVVAEPA